MTVSIIRTQPTALGPYIDGLPLSAEDRNQFRRCFLSSTELWVGYKDDTLVCIWGLVPPTLLADYAYLWLYTTPDLKGNEFAFVRHSQRAMEQMLEQYPLIVGHAAVDTPQSRAWLRWLGAVFKEPAGPIVPFSIRKRIRG